MKRWLIFLLLFSFVSASVDVDNYSVKEEYVFLDHIEGSVNLSIDGEGYDEKIILSDGSVVLLGDFLEDNGAYFECFPYDCSMSYNALPGALEKTISLPFSEDRFVGFVLEGDDVVLRNMSFKIESDFEEGLLQPLALEFFEDWEWGFTEFSDEFLLKDWGCFDLLNKEIGPLIGTSFYCEMIDIKNSDRLRVGADVLGSGEELIMAVYPGSGFGGSWQCSFDPTSEDGCIIDSDEGEMFYEGEYQVCVAADDLNFDYNIYDDETGDNCGFAYDSGPESSVKDYGIFAQGVKYADAGTMGVHEFNEDSLDAANLIIEDRYSGNCSEGCILPLKIFGVSQNFNIFDVKMDYTYGGDWASSNLVHELERSSARVYFNGTLGLNALGLNVLRDGEYFAELSGVELFRKNVKLLPVPIASSVFPLDPPAGVPIMFYTKIDFEGNGSLSYNWDFGDGEKANTDVPNVVHVYNNLGNHTLRLNVSVGGNLSSERSFHVEVVGPEEAIVIGLDVKRSYLGDVRDVVESFPSWYGKDILSILEIARFEDDLDRLERAYNNSFDAEEFRDVAKELYVLNIPVVAGANSFESPFLMSELSDVDIEPVTIVSGGVSGATNEDYSKSILTWQNDNMDVMMRNMDVFASYLNGEDREVLSVYSFDVTSRAGMESYFVINKPFGELYFNGDTGARKAGDSTVIILNAGESKSFEFYYKDGGRGSFFISPRLSSLVIEADIGTDCNFNDVCDESMGENSDNCRSDCKPVGKAIFFLIMGFLVFLVAYSGLQIWYKKNYEAYLFKDSEQLYNLLMYIANARARGLEDDKIGAKLRSRGWSGERVNYVMKKSLGKTVGLIEIIPIERISAWLRNREARKAAERAKGTATDVQQQNNNNINKSGIPVR